MASSDSEFEFDVALSFAGEDRPTVDQLANILKGDGFSVFYDIFYKADLWGRDLYQHLDEVYSKKARFCVMFLSEAYARKSWTNHELKSAQTRAFRENDGYILPVRLDDTAIPGIRPTLGYLDLRQQSVAEVAALTAEKIRAAKSRVAGQGQAGGPSGGDPTKPPASPPRPGGVAPLRAGSVQIKKQFTEYDRDAFLDEAFESIAQLFESSLPGLQTEHKDVIGKYKRVNSNHFTAVVYRNGRNVSQCGIRLGKMFSRKEILYSNEPDSTNSMNAGVSVEDDGQALYLKPMAITAMLAGRGKGAEKMTPQDAAEMFWGLLIAPLGR